VVAVEFEKGIVWIRWLGPHGAYDRIDVTEVKYEKRRQANPYEARL
jgi:mRNA interferase HigB